MPIRNVLFLLADQHRSDCIGAYGNKVVSTSNIDALAARGTRFTHAFTPAAICTPARACIQTGLSPRKHGLILNWEFNKFRGGLLNLPPETRGFSQDLSAAGWQCAHVGKWHIGDTNRPADYGYEGEYYPGYGFPDTHAHYQAYLRGLGVSGFNVTDKCESPSAESVLYYARQEGPPEASVPHYLAHQTVEKIEKYSATGKPFFISCNFWGPHAPFRIPAPYFDMYDPKSIDPWPNWDSDLSEKPYVIRRQGERFQTGWFTADVLRDLLAKHYGYVTLIDEQIGRIIAALRAAGQLENTMIIYAADHGSADGAFRMWDKGFGMYDNQWRIPLIAAHDSFRRGVNDDFVGLLDLAPTFLQAAGCAIRPELEGASLLPALQGTGSVPPRDAIIAEAFGHQIPYWQRMVRTKDAKYIYNPVDRDEFYDLREDPWEMRNLVDHVPADRVEPFKARLRKHIDSTGDQIRSMAKGVL